MDSFNIKPESNGDSVDGAIRIDVGDDFMSAYMNISGPVRGGKEITVSDAMEAVRNSSVLIEFERDAIVSLINNKEYNKRICIVQGQPPENGLHGTVSYRFDRFKVLAPQEDEKGAMDYKNLGLVHNIVAGTVIADITKETEGEDGFDIRGNALKATPGQKAKYAVGKGTYLNEDETQIIAEIDGNITWQKDRFTVEDTITIKEDVGSSTGNIDFIGDVVVKGNVMENFVVVSKKNVTIGGNATNAKIIADGSVEIKTGSINSSISAKGNVKIGFCENSKIECGGDLSSASFVACDIFCNGVVFATTGKGVIVGGRMTSLKGISANTIGSESFLKTRLTLGNDAILSEEKLSLEKEEANLTEQIGKLIQIIDMLNAHKKQAGSLSSEREDMLSSAIRTRFKYSNDIKLIKRRIEEIDTSILSSYNLYIEARKEIWPNVVIRIGTLQMKVENKNVRCRVYMNNAGEIEYKPIAGPTG
ncbi:MAG: FapA family protein [Oscillospiraceae bacterium]|jgi:uncharacterized protein (DUF342 family)|nr:FapA family protein [Oscillospiraceae bacterium]